MIIEFVRKKDYQLVQDIGQGGLGKTVLLKDEIIDEYFVCKKYSPLHEEHKEVYFENFIREIKLLHLVYHKNVVRIFNYYLYPHLTTGYILMEYIKGLTIDKYLKSNPNKIDEIFIQTIEGFNYLQQNKILHRDIRPQNILVSDEHNVKIIDLGFGKEISFDDEFEKSISLNWRYPVPNEFKDRQYDFKTEVYFVGKLFEEIITENAIKDFKYTSVLAKMINPNYQERDITYFDVSRMIINNKSGEINFSDMEKRIYIEFAEKLSRIITKINSSAEYIQDIDKIIQRLEDTYQKVQLENFVLNNSLIGTCFISGDFRYLSRAEMYSHSLLYFINILKNNSAEKRKVIINNIWSRLDTIDRIELNVDELPF